MEDDDVFFAAAPPAADNSDAPIVLGPPSDDPFAAPPAPADNSNYGDFVHAPEGEPAYLGDVNEAPPMVLGGGEEETGGAAEEEQEPPVPSGPTPMQVWNEGWQALLLERKEEENAKKAEFLEAAKGELAAFQAEREQKREAAMAKNREDEQAKLEAIEADLENDNSWQRVCKMVELQHDSTQKAQDVKRMRDVMILLKNEPGKAQALSA